MISGEGVTVLRREVAYDEAMDETEAWVEEAHVENVLFGKPRTEAIESGIRLYGVQVAYTLAFPKSYRASLRGRKVVRDSDGSEFAVVGDPAPLPDRLCPTPWNREADVRRSDG